MFRSKSSILGYLHLWKPPVLKGCLVCQICQVVPLSQDGGAAAWGPRRGKALSGIIMFPYQNFFLPEGILQRSCTGSEDWALVQVAETEPTQGQSAPSTVSHDRTRSAPHHSNSSMSQAKGAPESHILQQPIAR